MIEYALLTFGSLFAIVDPVAALPAYLALTSRETPYQRKRTALIACSTCCMVMTAFAALGPSIFRLFGITIPAFEIAGGLILLLSSLDMLRAKRSSMNETLEEVQAGSAKDEVAVTPLAIPMLSGPGAITTSIVLSGRASNWPHRIIFYACIVAVSALCYAILAAAATGARRLSPIAMNIMTRLMGILLAAIGVQFILSALGLRAGNAL